MYKEIKYIRKMNMMRQRDNHQSVNEEGDNHQSVNEEETLTLLDRLGILIF